MTERNVFMIMLSVIVFGILIMLLGCATPKKNPWPGWQGSNMDKCDVTPLQNPDGSFISTDPADIEAKEKVKRKAEFLQESGFK